ncbi:MAG: hypothetical protein JNM27_02160 [Leptospirales bacterium]|nr:hypothetical protein [Leptospirales bacterium]
MKTFKIKTALLLAILTSFWSAYLNAGELKWSDELPGRVDWAESSLQCQEKGMRLPLRKEIEAAHKAGTTSAWDYGLYWTSEEHETNTERAYVFNFDFKSAYDTRKSDKINARCVK